MREDRQAEAGLSQIRKARFPGELPDVVLGQARVEQRGGDVVLPGSLLAGTIISLVVDIDAVGNGIKAECSGDAASITVKSSSLQ